MVDELSPRAYDVVYKIRHAIRTGRLDDELASRHASALLAEPVMGVSQHEEYDALLEALDSSATLSTWRGDPRFERPIDEEAFRAHLRRVVGHLDVMRPWTPPLFRALAPERWNGYPAESRAVAAIHLWTPAVEDRLHVHLVPMVPPGGRGQVDVAILELRSGNEVAVVGRWWPDEPDVAAVLTRDPGASAGDLMAELTSEGVFREGEYEMVAGGAG